MIQTINNMGKKHSSKDIASDSIVGKTNSKNRKRPTKGVGGLSIRGKGNYSCGGSKNK